MKKLSEMELTEILRLGTRRRVLIGIILTLFLAGYFTYIRTATFKYVAELKVMPAQSSEGLLQGGLSGLAAAAGLRIGQGSASSPFLIYPTQIRSRELADALSKDQKLMQSLFSQNWNAEKGQWQEKTTTVGELKKAVKRILGIPVYAWQPPAGSDVQKLIENFIEIKEDKLTQIVTIRFASSNPTFAKEFLWKIHQNADLILRQRSLRRANQNVKYLQQKLNNLDVASYRQALTDILVQQERFRMIASSNVAFAAEPLGPPYTPATPTRPRSSLILALTLLIGSITAFLTSLLLEVKAAKRSQV
jgi:uncharacterized protein involved in exopolysaccharide biosynthesis